METILHTICCQNGIIPVVSAWAGIASLFVAIWTLWNVKSVRATIDDFRKKRLLRVRLAHHFGELQDAALTISGAVNKEPGVDMPQTIKALEVISKICENIKMLDDAGSISLSKINELEDSCRQTSPVEQRKPSQQNLKTLYQKLMGLIEEIRVSLDNIKAEADDGFR